MASTARWGLKHPKERALARHIFVGMASTARWGLKLRPPLRPPQGECGRNGLYSPLGIETFIGIKPFALRAESEWPLQPVGD